MKECISCKESSYGKDTHISHLYNDEKAMDMHIHDCYEIYYSISGGKQFLIDNYFYDISDGDIFRSTSLRAIIFCTNGSCPLIRSIYTEKKI